MLKFLDTTATRAFAESIVADYDRLCRSSALRDGSAEKLHQKLGNLAQRFEQFCRENKPNFYKKAKMIQVIQSGLEGKGIPAAQVSAFVNEVLVKRLKGVG